jgi:hypothetical protein
MIAEFYGRSKFQPITDSRPKSAILIYFSDPILVRGESIPKNVLLSKHFFMGFLSSRGEHPGGRRCRVPGDVRVIGDGNGICDPWPLLPGGSKIDRHPLNRGDRC